MVISLKFAFVVLLKRSPPNFTRDYFKRDALILLYLFVLSISNLVYIFAMPRSVLRVLIMEFLGVTLRVEITA
jgi:hypothetical protein